MKRTATPLSSQHRLQLEDRLERDLSRLLRVHGVPEDVERTGDLLDVSTALMARQNEMAGRQRALRNISDVSAALRRLRQHPDEFGLCTRCSLPIGYERLDILPTTETCLPCS